MTTAGWVIVAIIVIVVIAVAAYLVWRAQRTKQLSERFGPEYERTVRETDSRRRAEAELAARAKRRESLDIRPLTPTTRDRYVASWRETQARFVDMPDMAVKEADALVSRVMSERGYPMDDFEQRAADISVDHADVVENYRAAHAISLASDQGQASTEDLREAMVHYRALFNELLETNDSDEEEEVR